MIKLTRKNLLDLLVNGQGRSGTATYIPPHPMLAELTRDFYARLMLHNPGYEVFGRGVDDRRFDALARLLVGDETCAAVGFNGRNVIIATNRAEHPEQRLTYQVNNKLSFGMSLTDGLDVTPILYLYVGSRHICTKIGGTIHYEYDPRGFFVCNSLQPIHFHIDAIDHAIPFIPDFPIGVKLKLNEAIPAPSAREFNSTPPAEKNIETLGIQREISIEPLARRVEKLFDLPLRLLAKATLEHRADLLEKFENSPDTVTWRESFLHDSLVWQTSTWFTRAGLDPRDFSNPAVMSLREFVSNLNQDYAKFKRDNDIVCPSTAAMHRWASLVVSKMKIGNLEAPPFIAKNAQLFMDRALRVFLDIEKFFDFIRMDAAEGGDFSRVLADEYVPIERGSYPPKSNVPVIVPPDLPDGTHAEFRVLKHSDGLLKYVATSKLSCALCNLVFKTFGAEHVVSLDGENHSGGHGKLYPWVLPDEFYNNTEFMTYFLSAELYEALNSIRDEKLNLNGENYTIGQLFRLIIESVGKLEESDLDSLGVRAKISELLGKEYVDGLKLFHREDDLPYESDDEDAPASHSASGASLAHRKFLLHPILADGNCMFEAAREGAILIGREDAPADQMTLRAQIRDLLTARPELVAQAITDMVMTGDLRGVNDDGFRTILKELITQRQEFQRAHLLAHEIRENILGNVLGRNLAGHYIALLDQDGFWGGEVELGAAADILQVRIIVHRGNRELPINPANNDGTFPEVHLRFNGGHYDVLIRNPDYIEPAVEPEIANAGAGAGAGAPAAVALDDSEVASAVVECSGSASGSFGGDTHAAPVLDFDSAAAFAAVLVAGIVLSDTTDHS